MAREPLLGRARRSLSFEEVLAKERDKIQERESIIHSHLRQAGKAGRRVEEGAAPKFSVAFSGGGIRAASFQAGVLWRLAEMGKLKDVEYLATVSGGGYLSAALATHAIEAGEPSASEDVDEWYRRLVAKTIRRLQENCPYLARDVGKGPLGMPKDGSASVPRIMDVPILLAVIVSTVLVKPAFVLLAVLIPFLEILDFFFGPMMRLINCAAVNKEHIRPVLTILLSGRGEYYLRLLATVYVVVLVLYYGLTVSRKLKGPGGSYRRRVWYLLKGCTSLFNRILLVLILLFWLVPGVTVSEILSNFHSGTYPPYYQCDQKAIAARMECAGLVDIGELRAPSNSTDGQWHAHHMLDWVASYGWYFPVHWELQLSLFGILCMFLGALVLAPLFPIVLKYWTLAVGPLVFVSLITGLVRWRVFGPYVCLQAQASVHSVCSGVFFHEHWRWLSLASVLIGAAMLLAYRHLSFVHLYYQRCIRQAFFADGADQSFGSIEENRYCPFLLFSGTNSDYKRPDDSSHRNVVTFSCLHTGSHRMGYVRAPREQSLVQIVALSGAATDVFLHRGDEYKGRFWLETLNLYMGGFVQFGADPGDDSTMIGVVIWSVVYALVFVGVLVDNFTNVAQCSVTSCCYKVSVLLAMSTLILSFFYGLWPSAIDPLLHSPIIRAVHRFTRHYHIGDMPPSLMYVVDGGVMDTTGLVELVRRRCRRILMVYGGNDPKDTGRSLKKAMKLVLEEKLGEFYDPDDPRRSTDEMFNRFRDERNARFLRIGVLYPRRGDEEPQEVGHIFFVKNRIPTDLQRTRVRPLLTEREVLGCSAPPEGQLPPDMEQEELRGCCCDCCHRSGLNRGRRFPNPSTLNQFLTPQMVSSLCRLGHDVSREGIEGATAGDDELLRQWEVTLRASSAVAPGGLG